MKQKHRLDYGLSTKFGPFEWFVIGSIIVIFVVIIVLNVSGVGVNPDYVQEW